MCVAMQTAALPKERARYSKKYREVLAQLQDRVGQYNKLLPFGVRARVEPAIADLVQHKYCWMEEYNAGAGYATQASCLTAVAWLLEVQCPTLLLLLLQQPS